MESDNNHRPGLRMDRRKFLSSATAAVSRLVSTSKTEAERRSDQTAPAAEPPGAASADGIRDAGRIFGGPGTEVLCQQPGI